MRAEEIFFLGIFLRDVGELGGRGEIERILGIARRVVSGSVEGVETVILGLDLGAVSDGEADLAENAAHLFADECERVVGAGPAVGGRQRGVDGGAELGLELGGLDLREGGIEQRLEAGLGLVDELAEAGALVLWHGAHLLHQRGEFSVGADVARLGGFELRARGERGELGLRFGDEGGEGVLHGKLKLNHSGTESTEKDKTKKYCDCSANLACQREGASATAAIHDAPRWMATVGNPPAP